MTRFNEDGVEASHVVINLLIGPRLTTSKVWWPVLERLTKRDLIQMIVVDKVPYVQQSRSFRPEFGPMIKFLRHLLTVMPRPCPRLLLTATLVQEDLDKLSEICFGVRPNILHGPLNCRGITFKIVVSGDAVSTLNKAAR